LLVYLVLKNRQRSHRSLARRQGSD